MTPPPLPPEGSRPPISVPPPIPALNEDAPVTGIAGAEGFTHRQLLEEIGRGGRFVTFLYAISVVFMTFRRSTDVRFVRAGETVGASAWGPTLLTIVAGWWGIPWGPIFSVQSIFRNAMGGKDVTEIMLTPVVGAERAKAALKLRPKQVAGAGLWSLRAALLAIPLALAGIFFTAGAEGERRSESLRQSPGYGALHSAASNLDGQAGGNNAVARSAALAMKTLLDDSVETETRSGKQKKPKPFGVWCEFHERDIVVLVRWDDLRRLSKSARENFTSIVWQSACLTALKDGQRSTGDPLMIGLKGQFLWDGALLGKLPLFDGLVDSQPAQTISGHDTESRIIAAFATAPTH